MVSKREPTIVSVEKRCVHAFTRAEVVSAQPSWELGRSTFTIRFGYGKPLTVV
jgi:hypothetical protein